MPGRREFLAIGAAAIASGRRLANQESAMLATAPIPSTGERLPRIGLGTWQTFDIRAASADYLERRRALRETLERLVAAGATVVDSSPMYGESETVVGDLVRELGIRSRVFLATKVWTSGGRRGIEQMESSIKKLGAGRMLDLMQIHNLVDWRTHLRTLRDWKAAGRIRYLGITHYQAAAIPEVAAIVRAEPLDFVQMNLSLEEPEAAASLLALCADRGVAFIANRPFGGGGALARVRSAPLPNWAADYQIRTWSQFLLKWVLAHSEVTCAIPGTGNPRHLVDNLEAARGPLPDGAARQRMARAWSELS